MRHGPVYHLHTILPSTQHVGLVPSKPRDSVRGSRFCVVGEGSPIDSVRILLKGHSEVARRGIKVKDWSADTNGSHADAPVWGDNSGRGKKEDWHA
jgi:hypothetical protein